MPCQSIAYDSVGDAVYEITPNSIKKGYESMEKAHKNVIINLYSENT